MQQSITLNYSVISFMPKLDAKKWLHMQIGDFIGFPRFSQEGEDILGCCIDMGEINLMV